MCKIVENFCSYVHESSEQHVDSRLSRMNRDVSDIKKLMNFYSQYEPFPVTNAVVSITTGLVGNSTINCHLAYEIGIELCKKDIGKNVEDLKFEKKIKFCRYPL